MQAAAPAAPPCPLCSSWICYKQLDIKTVRNGKKVGQTRCGSRQPSAWRKLNGVAGAPGLCECVRVDHKGEAALTGHAAIEVPKAVAASPPPCMHMLSWSASPSAPPAAPPASREPRCLGSRRGRRGLQQQDSRAGWGGAVTAGSSSPEAAAATRNRVQEQQGMGRWGHRSAHSRPRGHPRGLPGWTPPPGRRHCRQRRNQSPHP